MRNLDMDALRTFLVCATAPSFQTAADLVNKSQSTVSVQMRRLEETVGRPLFEKRGRRNVLTDVGRELASYAERIVRLNDEAVGRLHPREFAGSVRVGSCEDYSEALLHDAFGRFAARHPTVEMVVECKSSSVLARNVERGELDLAIVSISSSITNAEVLRRESLAWLAPMDRNLELERPLPVAVWHATCSWRERTLRSLEDAGIAFRIASTGGNAAALAATVRAGLAVAEMPERLQASGLRRVGPDAGLPPASTFEIGLAVAPGEPSPIAAAFASEIRNALAAQPVAQSVAQAA